MTPEINLDLITANLYRGEEGIWFSRTKSPVSYPDDGSDFCFGVEETSFWFQHRNRCLLAAMERFPPPGVLLDIGGGNGFVSLAVQKAGWPVILVEPMVQGARNAARRGLAQVVCSTLEDAGFAESSLAAAGAFDVVEHIQDDAGFIRLMARMLAPNGRLYLMVPALNSLWSQEDEEAGHYRRYTRAMMRRLLEPAGFEVEYLTYFFRLLPPPVFLWRSLSYRLGIRRSEAELRSRAVVEHSGPPGWLRPLLENLLHRELRLVRAGKAMRFGGSCFAIARKR
jgi:SAM-dependent methyltransferase